MFNKWLNVKVSVVPQWRFLISAKVYFLLHLQMVVFFSPPTVMQWHHSFRFISREVWFKGLLKSLGSFPLTHSLKPVANLCPRSAHPRNRGWNWTWISHRTLYRPNWYSYLKWKVNGTKKTAWSWQDTACKR